MPEYGINSNAPFNHAAAITLSDSAPLATPTRGIYVGGAGPSQ